MERVIVTGPTGSIGLALITELVKHNIKVMAVCRPDSKRKNRIPKHSDITLVECGLENILELPQMIDKKVDVFYHFAWDGTFGNSRNDMELQNENIKYTLHAVRAAKALGCAKFVGAGSQAEYGRSNEILSPNTPTFPENGYGIAKLCAGQMSRLLCNQLGLEHIWTRILSVYGPYDGKNTMIMSTIYKLLKGEKPALTKGDQLWDYIYSEDAAKAFYLIGERGKNGETYCLGSGKARPLKEYIMELRDVIDSKLALGFGEVPYGEKQIMYLCSDINNLTRDTGFVPKTRFEDGIRKTIQWCKVSE